MISTGTPKAKAFSWGDPDGERRKRGEQKGLDTLVVHAVNDVCWILEVSTLPVSSKKANALSTPPGEYGRKAKTQRNRRGPAQAVEHVV